MTTVKRMDADMEEARSEKPYINVTEQKYNRYDVFLDEPIGRPSEYRELNYLLFSAEENDRFNIFINSPGGHLDSALSIIEGLKNTQGYVTGIIQGECHSAASMIMMYCHEIIVLDSAYVMIHTANFGTVGNTGNVKAHTEFITRQVEKLLDDTYSGFLTESEMEKVKLGVELWFSADEVRERMDRRIAYLEEKHKEEADAAEEDATTRRRKRKAE